MHHSDGMTYLYTNQDLSQFSDNFWPTIDAQRLPGTTVNYAPPGSLLPVAVASNMESWVGGVPSYDGQCGLLGMALDSGDISLLRGKKSWFLFDDEIVALGTDITSCLGSKCDGYEVETIVENRRLTGPNGNNALLVNGIAQPATLPWSATLNNVTRVNLAGNGANSDIGYYFPVPVTLQALRENRTADWNEIGTTTSGPVSNKYLTMYVNHGPNPTSGSYAYVILPNKTSGQTFNYYQNPNTTIVANDGNAQAVYESTLNAFAGNFWNDSGTSLTVAGLPNWITVNKKASVFVDRDLVNGQWIDEISISDPTRLNTGTIGVELKWPVVQVVTQSPEITVTRTSPTTHFEVNVNGTKGKPLFLKLREN
jgi:hyaluronate lyase